MVYFHTANRHGYGVKFSTLGPNVLAVVACEQFGLSGNSTLFILHINQDRTIEEIKQYHWANSLLDLCWSELTPNFIVTASGDGFLQIWNLDVIHQPISAFPGHSQEVSCVDWQKYSLLSASWDRSIKIWDVNQHTCLITLLGHSGSIHEAKFSPEIPNILGSVSGNGTLKLWSTLSKCCLTSIQVHDAEVLSLDWNKYSANLLATSSSDSLIRCWDIRNYRQPLFQIKTGDRPVKQIRFSPHFPHILASACFDFSTQIWDIRHKEPLEKFHHHSEFVYGLDWNRHKIGELADCSWDSTVQVFESQILQNLKNKM